MRLQFIHLRGEMRAAAMGGNVRLVFEGIRPGDVCERFTCKKATKYKSMIRKFIACSVTLFYIVYW